MTVEEEGDYDEDEDEQMIMNMVKDHFGWKELP